MVKAGWLPVVRGINGADQDDALLPSEADKIGYPVLIKAVAGAAAKAMRLVEEGGRVSGRALDSANVQEAKTSFGNADVWVREFRHQASSISGGWQVFWRRDQSRASV